MELWLFPRLHFLLSFNYKNDVTVLKAKSLY